MSERRLFIVAGEASGDTHAARLVTALRAANPKLCVEGLGGEKMRQAGCQLRADLVSEAVMGFANVIRNLGFFRRLFSETAQRLKENPPDALVLVDYPGFNLRLAAAAKKLQIPIVYYISPQVWAWRPRRIKKIAKLVDKMIVILPFEEQLYRNQNVDVTYVGHPLLDNIAETELDTEFLERVNGQWEPLIGLFPGSRRQEIVANLPVMAQTAKVLRERMPRAGFLVPCSDGANMELVKGMLDEAGLPVEVFVGKMYEVAKASRCCIVKSGTATLETACFLTPLVVVYRTSHLLWLAGKLFLHVPHVSLVNILAGEEVVPEVLQYKMRSQLLADTVAELCRDGERRSKTIEDLRRVRRLLGAPGASREAARTISEFLDPGGAATLSATSAQSMHTANG